MFSSALHSKTNIINKIFYAQHICCNGMCHANGQVRGRKSELHCPAKLVLHHLLHSDVSTITFESQETLSERNCPTCFIEGLNPNSITNSIILYNTVISNIII